MRDTCTSILHNPPSLSLSLYCIEESVLRDLKALLMEAKQRVPPFLTTIDSLNDDLVDLGGRVHVMMYSYFILSSLSLLSSPISLSLLDDHGCAYCGGLGHRITNCPKLEAVQQKQAGTIGRKDYLASSAADW